MTENYLSHHGVKGMKWGVRRHRNTDGSLSSDKKEYKKNLKADKEYRRDLELRAYDSAKFANVYYEQATRYSKKYNRAIAKDPTESKSKTQRIKNTKKLLDANAKDWAHYNSENIQRVKKQVEHMINKYSDTKIKDVDVRTLKNGMEYVNSVVARISNANATYGLRKHKDNIHNVDIYTPLKIRTYYC